MKVKSVAKAVAVPFQKLLFRRRLNSDFEAIKRGHTQAYPLNWEKIKQRYLKNEHTLRQFLHKVAGLHYRKKGGQKLLAEPFLRCKDSEIERFLGLPPYTIELQKIVETRRADVKKFKSEKNKPAKLISAEFYLEMYEKMLKENIDKALNQNKTATKSK